MEVRYKRDLYASYMLIEIPANIIRDSYPFKMLKENRMKRILPCKEWSEDGTSYLHIDISGKKNLTQEFKERDLELEDMISIFQQLLPALEELREFLLTEKMVILEPEFIYRDSEAGTLFLTLLPWESEENNNLHKLAEFFLEKMNQRDEHGVNAAYHFYRQQAQPKFSLYHFLPVLEKESILKRRKNVGNTLEGQKGSISKEKEYAVPLPEEEPGDEWGRLSLPVSKKEKTKNYMWFIPLAIGGVILGISFTDLFSRNQRISVYALSAVLIIAAIAGRFITFRNRKRKKPEIPIKEEPEQEDMSQRIMGGEETVFFDSLEDEDLLKLQWKERGRTRQVLLKDFPCTVGKIKEEVSIVIRDMSVSRVHCRFVEKERGIGIMDLNSTNGTYLNGMKLKQGEILEIVKNDEILIGKVRMIVV